MMTFFGCRIIHYLYYDYFTPAHMNIYTNVIYYNLIYCNSMNYKMYYKQKLNDDVRLKFIVKALKYYYTVAWFKT